MDYALEKFYLATLGLARGAGNINERLGSAAVGLSVLSNPKVDLQGRIRTVFDKLWSELPVRDAEEPDEGKIGATVRQLEEARELAERIFSLYFDLYFDVLGITPFGRPREELGS
jgi:hypothetical protein